MVLKRHAPALRHMCRRVAKHTPWAGPEVCLLPKMRVPPGRSGDAEGVPQGRGRIALICICAPAPEGRGRRSGGDPRRVLGSLHDLAAADNVWKVSFGIMSGQQASESKPVV